MSGKDTKMQKDRLEVPVVMIVFNRFDTMCRVFEGVRKVKPLKFYIVSDAPRKQKDGEKEKVEKVRRYIETHIDWECEKHFVLAEENMGCQRRVASGLDFVFQREEAAIILEDDCVPHTDFFRFCEAMLSHYKDDERIMQISGCNLVPEHKINESYLFSVFCSIWGWATWRRAWEKFDFSMKEYPEFKKKKIIYQLFPESAAQIIEGEMDRVYDGRMNSWAYRWLLARMVNSGLGITPAVNLIDNIGVGRADATHTKKNANYRFDMAAINSPITIKNSVYRDYIYEKEMASKYYHVNLLQKMIVRYLPDNKVAEIKRVYNRIRQ